MGARYLLLILLVVLIWGCNFPIAKFGLQHIPPFLYISLRFLISFVVLLPFYPLPRTSAKSLLLLSLVFGLGHFGLFFFALSFDVQASTASLLMQMGPPMAVLMGALLLKEKFSSLQAAGLLCAVLGVVLIIGVPKVPPHPLGAALMLLSAFFWAASNLLMKRMVDLRPLEIMCWMAGFSCPFFLLLWGLREGFSTPSAPPLAYLSVLYPSLCSTVVAYGLWNHLLKQVKVSQLTPFGLLVPLVGVVSSFLLLGERLELGQLLGAVVLITGLALITVVPAWIGRRRLKFAVEQPIA